MSFDISRLILLVSAFMAVSGEISGGLAATNQERGVVTWHPLRNRELVLVQSVRSRLMEGVIKTKNRDSIVMQLNAIESQLQSSDEHNDALRALAAVLKDLQKHPGKNRDMLDAAVVAFGNDQISEEELIERLNSAVCQWDVRQESHYRAVRLAKAYVARYAKKIAPWGVLPIIAYTSGMANVAVSFLPMSAVLADALLKPTVKAMTEAWTKSHVKNVLVPAVSDATKSAVAYVSGEPLPSMTSPVKASSIPLKSVKVAPDAKEVLTAYATFFKDADRYNSKACAVSWNLLVEGTDRARALEVAHGLANEIGWNIQVVHASKLSQQPLKEILERLEEESPCILAIDELDWLLGNTDAGSEERLKAVSDLIESLVKYTNPKNSKRIVVVATVRKPELLDESMRELFGTRVAIEQQLESELGRELREWVVTSYGVQLAEATLDRLVSLAQRTSYARAQDCVRQACVFAHALGLPLASSHIDRMIALIP